MDYVISPAGRISGTVEMPGDKSISHRALMIAAIAEGESHIEKLSDGADVASTITCLEKLGVKILREDNIATVHGVGMTGLKPPARMLDVGNSGTTIRLLSGILAGQPFRSQITGDESIRARPMARIVEPLRQMGAEVMAVKNEYPPLSITGGGLQPIYYEMPVASAQVKSCLLLAGLYAHGRTEVVEPARTRDHTELMLVKFGANVQKMAAHITVDGPAQLTAQEVLVPGDLSSAACFIAAASLLPDSDILIKNVGINPTRKAFLALLADFGADLDIMNVRTQSGELTADLFVRSSNLTGMTIEGSIVPQIIDEIPILAIMASQAEGRTEIRDAGELRHKESDRLRSLAFNLQRMGVKVTEKPDGLIIDGPAKLQSAEIESFNDHRIAMSFAVAGLLAAGESRIKNADCVAISHPGFFQALEDLVER